MKIKNKILTGLATLLFSLAPQPNLEAIPATPKELPKGWRIQEPKKEIKVKINDKEYLETLITTENPVEHNGKHTPELWTTTDPDGKPILDVNECKRADITATIAYLDERCNLAQLLEDLGKSYKNASKLTFGYDVLEKSLKKLLEIEGKLLKEQLTGGAQTLTDIAKEELKEGIKELKENIKKEIEERGIVNLAEKIKGLIENSVYYKLDLYGKALVELSDKIKKHEGIWSYEEAAYFYANFKTAWINASSTIEFWTKLRDYTAKEIAVSIADSLVQGAAGKSLEELIGISIDKDEKLKQALEASQKKKSEIEGMFRKHIEHMFDYSEKSDFHLFFHPELMGKRFDLSAPEKTLELFIDGMNNKKFSYNEIKKLLTGAELEDINFKTEEDYKKTMEKSDEKVLDHKILNEYILSDKVHVILSQGDLVSGKRKKDDEYLISTFINEDGDWKIFALEGKESGQLERMISPIKSFNKGLELGIRGGTYNEFKRFYEDKLHEIWNKEDAKKNLERCKDILEKEISSGLYTEEELGVLGKEKEGVEKYIQSLEK